MLCKADLYTPFHTVRIHFFHQLVKWNTFYSILVNHVFEVQRMQQKHIRSTLLAEDGDGVGKMGCDKRRIPCMDTLIDDADILQSLLYIFTFPVDVSQIH